MNFKVVILQILIPDWTQDETSWDVGIRRVPTLKFTIYFLFLTVLGDHWELGARIGTVRKLSFHTFRKQQHFSVLKTFFGWKMCETTGPLPQNTTLSEFKLAKSRGNELKMTNNSILARCTGTKIDMRWEEVLRVNCANFGANISCCEICDETLNKSTECLCLQWKLRTFLSHCFSLNYTRE